MSHETYTLYAGDDGILQHNSWNLKKIETLVKQLDSEGMEKIYCKTAVWCVTIDTVEWLL